MKLSSILILTTVFLLVCGMFASNALLKKEYDRLDKTDNYWTYGKINDQPFRYLKIDGGNLTNIAFEPSAKWSVKVLKNWDGYEKGVVKAAVRQDTLFLQFPKTYGDIREREYLQYNTMVRIFAPELLSVEGVDTRIGLYKMKQKSFRIDLRGKSQLEVESYVHRLDSVYIQCKDSARIVFEISPDSLHTDPMLTVSANPPATRQIRKEGEKMASQVAAPAIHSWEAMAIGAVHADISGVSLVDLGHAQIDSLTLTIADTSGIILSGQTLRSSLR